MKSEEKLSEQRIQKEINWKAKCVNAKDNREIYV